MTTSSCGCRRCNMLEVACQLTSISWQGRDGFKDTTHALDLGRLVLWEFVKTGSDFWIHLEHSEGFCRVREPGSTVLSLLSLSFCFFCRKCFGISLDVMRLLHIMLIIERCILALLLWFSTSLHILTSRFDILRNYDALQIFSRSSCSQSGLGSGFIVFTPGDSTCFPRYFQPRFHPNENSQPGTRSSSPDSIIHFLPAPPLLLLLKNTSVSGH